MSDNQILQEAFDAGFDAVKGYVDRSLREIHDRLDAIEKKGIEYKGVYQSAQEYKRGHIVTHKGAMWHANVFTRSVPGTNAEWTLCVKAGRDA